MGTYVISDCPESRHQVLISNLIDPESRRAKGQPSGGMISANPATSRPFAALSESQPAGNPKTHAHHATAEEWSSSPRWVKGWKSIRQQRAMAAEFKDINVAIQRTSSTQELLELCDSQKQFSPINVVTILSKLALFQNRNMRTKASYEQSQKHKRVIGAICGQIASGASGYAPQHVAQGLTLLRKLKVKLPDNLLSAVDDQVKQRGKEFTLSQLAAISSVQAVARRGFHQASLEESVRRLSAVDSQKIEPGVLTELAWAFSSLGQPSEPVLLFLGQKLVHNADSFSGSELSTAIWACHVAE
eukprot:scaffold240911_cov38-Prasinocladus_malaysianus.AAC.2